jgi:putative membrane protein
MIYYDPHKWLEHLFDVRGTLLREIAVRVGVTVLWSVAVVAFHHHVFDVGIPLTIHTLAGLALGLLLVFRTNASYERFWEGRRLWGGIVNDSRNLVRQGGANLRQDPRLLQQLTRWTAIFPWAVTSVLRGEQNFGPFAQELPSSDLGEMLAAQHPAMYVAGRMTACLREALDRHILSDIIYTSLDRNVGSLVDHLGGCERIRKTPLPFAYVSHLRRALILYCFTLPFALVSDLGWGTVPGVLFISYTFFGIEEIGVEIEGPFGRDANDLPLEEICETIQRNVYAMSDMRHAARDVLPEGL